MRISQSQVMTYQLLKSHLEDAAEQLFNLPDEGSLPVLCMNKLSSLRA